MTITWPPELSPNKDDPEPPHTVQDLRELTKDWASPKREAIEWLDARQAAAYVCIGVGTVRDACNRKALRHVRVGGRARGPIRTRREWVDEWLEGWVHGGERT